MPKQIKAPDFRITWSEVYECLEAAKRKVGESKLGDRELLAIAIVAWDSSLIVPLDWQYSTLEDFEVSHHQVCEIIAKRLAWAFYLDADEAFQALDAARRESKRIRKTDTWMALQVIRSLSGSEALNKNWSKNPRLFHLQNIIEGVERVFKVRVTEKTIHKALRRERELQIKWQSLTHGLDHTEYPDNELRRRLE